MMTALSSIKQGVNSIFHKGSMISIVFYVTAIYIFASLLVYLTTGVFPNELYKLSTMRVVIIGALIELPFQLFVFASLPNSIAEAFNYSYKPYLFFSNGLRNFGKFLAIGLVAAVVSVIYVLICIFVILLASKLTFLFIGIIVGLICAVFGIYLIRCIYKLYLSELLISNLPFKDNLRIACSVSIKSLISFFVLLFIFGLISFVIAVCTILLHNQYIGQIIYCFLQACVTVILLTSLMFEFDLII